MKKENKNAGLNQKCHSRKLVSGISTLDTQNGGDPRLQVSGMTINFNKSDRSHVVL